MRKSLNTFAPRSFGDGSVEQIPGIEWDEDTQTIKELVFKDYMMTSLHKRKTAFLVGAAGCGKTTLHKSVAQVFCARTGLARFFCGKALDPIGIMTKHGETAGMSCFMWSDVDMKSCNNVRLDTESVKNILAVDDEASSYPARYHVAVLPRFKPRIFSVNTSLYPDGSVNHGFWFDCNGMDYVGMLARREQSAILAAGDEAISFVRRAIIFFPTRELIGLNRANIEAQMQEEIEVELAREKAYFADM